MSLSDYQSVEITDFRGPWTRLEKTDVPPTVGLLARNCEFLRGQVKTRFGFGSVWNPNEAITSLYNWVKGADGVSAGGSYLIYFTGSKVRGVSNLASPSPGDLFTQSGAYAAMAASGGSRLYVATFNTAGRGAGQLRVAGVFGAELQVDTAFLGPVSVTPTLGEAATGVVTAGTHRVGYIVQTRNGFLGKVSGITSIDATGEKYITFSVTATWPVGASKVFPVMTSTTNLNRYFIVPGLEAAVPSGASLAVNFTINIADADLIATSKEVTNQTTLLTQDGSGNGPFHPFSVIEYGSRISYQTDIDGVSQAYVSEPENHQHITADQHVLYLPGFRKMTAQFVNGGVLYMTGPHWTYAYRDNGRVPVEWAVPELVDGSIGTLSPRGVASNTSRGYSWVADQSGLYLLHGGRYQETPVTYYVDDQWKRINWAAAHVLEVKDDASEQRVIVKAPLDDATVANSLFVFDYQVNASPTPDKVDFSEFTGASYGAIEIVQNPTTKRLELWYGSAAAGKVMRQKNASDTSPYSDDGAGIDFAYETACLPGKQKSMGDVCGHHADQIRAMGSGALAMTVRGIDGEKSEAREIALSTAPGQLYTKRYYLTSEAATIRFEQNEADKYTILSSLKHFFSRLWRFRA